MLLLKVALYIRAIVRRNRLGELVTPMLSNVLLNYDEPPIEAAKVRKMPQGVSLWTAPVRFHNTPETGFGILSAFCIDHKAETAKFRN